jgi:WhiB family redox-sensing transcriptional regulator
VFDAAAADRRHLTQVAAVRQAALQICAHCPELTRCRDWVDSLPASQRPLGVIAGRIITFRR